MGTEKVKQAISDLPPPLSTLQSVMDPAAMVLSGKRTDSAIRAWQRKYCEYHVSCGHAGYCYAWLDNAFCPQVHLTGNCRMKHAHPDTWTAEQKSQHLQQIEFMKDLWRDSVLCDAPSEGEGSDSEQENENTTVEKDKASDSSNKSKALLSVPPSEPRSQTIDKGLLELIPIPLSEVQSTSTSSETGSSDRDREGCAGALSCTVPTKDCGSVNIQRNQRDGSSRRVRISSPSSFPAAHVPVPAVKVENDSTRGKAIDSPRGDAYEKPRDEISDSMVDDSEGQERKRRRDSA
jgi:hypothetical protein